MECHGLVIVAGEGVDAAQVHGGSEDLLGNALIMQPFELGAREADAVLGFELFVEILFKPGAVTVISAHAVLEHTELGDEIMLALTSRRVHCFLASVGNRLEFYRLCADLAD